MEETIMVFAATLNQYMAQLGCSVIKLAEISGLSKSTISRYKTGVRLPEAGSGTVRQLSGALAEFAPGSISEDELFRELYAAYEAEKSDFDYDKFSKRLDMLIRTLGINITQMALYCSMDVSNLSRVRSGLRKPRDPYGLIPFLADYTVRTYPGISDRRSAAELMGVEPSSLDGSRYSELLIKWLSGENVGTKRTGRAELSLGFDLDDFLRARNIGMADGSFDEAPLPPSKTYIGSAELEEGLLDFISSTGNSRSPRDIVIHTELPIDSYSDEFIRGIASLCVKGLHIHVIHTVDRPFPELMRGLEAWLPLYMTGMITPYYLEHSAVSPFRHLLLVSGSAALFGDAVLGMEDHGEYRFSREDRVIAGARARADRLLSYAKPLFELFSKDESLQLSSMLDREFSLVSSVKSFLTAPPIFTIGDALLSKILERNHVSGAERAAVISFVNASKKRYALLLKNGSLLENVAVWSEAEFAAHPVALPICGAFLGSDVFYSYEEYLAHIREAEVFAQRSPRYHLTIDRAPDFRGMSITILGENTVLVSKNRAKELLLVSKQRTLVEALSSFTLV